MKPMPLIPMIAVSVALSANAVDLSAAPGYRVVDLGLINPFTTPSLATSINDHGQVGGTAVSQAFIADGMSIASVATGLGVAINNSGQMAGFAYDYPQNNSMRAQAFRRAGNTVQKIGIPNSFGLGINNLGQVSGALESPGDGGYRAFIWDGGTPQLLGTLGGSSSYGSGINDSGWLTGASNTGVNGAIHAFVWNGNTLQDIGTLGGDHFPDSYGTAINEQGWVTGWSFHYDADWNVVNRAFLWDGSMLHDLGSLTGSSESYGYGINNYGQVVGSSIDYGGMFGFGYGTPNPQDFAFLYDNGTVWKLNDLIEPASADWNVLLATGINDNGQIAASGCHPQLGCRALRLDPLSAVPLPPSALMMLSGLGLIISRRRRIQPRH